MGSLLELRWHKDSQGYVLQRARASSLAFLARSALAKHLPDEWLDDESWYSHVVPCGGESKLYRCEGNDFRILGDLVNMPNTPEGVLGFVHQWGLLDAPAREEFQRVQWFIGHRDVLRGVLRGEGLPHAAGSIELASVKLVRGPTGQLSLRADTLGDFLWAQAFQHRHGAFFQCAICKKFAMAPNKKIAKAPERTGRPPKFCSNACRSKAYRQGLTGRQPRGSPRARTRIRA
jgi:hypothetical protein